MWGVDFLFGYYNMIACVYNKYKVEHVLPSKSNSKEALELMHKYLNKVGFNKNIFKQKIVYKKILY